MTPVQHITTNTHAHMPEGLEGDTLPLTAVADELVGVRLVSFWQPSAEEIAAIVAGRCVVLQVFGPVQPVVAIGVEEIVTVN